MLQATLATNIRGADLTNPESLKLDDAIKSKERAEAALAAELEQQLAAIKQKVAYCQSKLADQACCDALLKLTEAELSR